MKLNIKFIFMYTINLIIINNLIISNYLMNKDSSNSYILLLILSLISILIVILLPNNFQEIINKIKHQKLIRIFITIYLVIISIELLFTYIYFIKERYFFLTPLYLIIIFILYFIYHALKSHILQIKSILFISFIIIMVISLFHLFNNAPKDINLILPISFNNLNIFNYIFLLGYLFDSFTFLLLPSNKSVQKIDIIISIIMGSIISAINILDNLLYLPPDFFYSLNFPSFYRYKLYYGPKYIEHFDNFLQIILSIFIISKLTINFELLRINTHIKKSIFYNLFITLSFSIIIIILFYKIGFNINYLFIPSLIITFIILFLLINIWRNKLNE